MTTKVTKGIKLTSGYTEFTLNQSSSITMTLEIKRPASDQRDNDSSFSMYVTEDQMKDIIKTFQELLDKVKK